MTLVRSEFTPMTFGSLSKTFLSPQHHSTLMNQLLVDVWDLDALFLDDLEVMNSMMHRVLAESGISVVSHDAHKFPGQGLTLTYLLRGHTCMKSAVVGRRGTQKSRHSKGGCMNFVA